MLLVYFPPMPDGKCKDDKTIILNGTDQAIVADAVTPLPLSVRRECLAKCTRILAVDKIFRNPATKDTLCIAIQLLKIRSNEAVVCTSYIFKI